MLLPDGAEFKTWEAPLDFSRTYYVDGSSPAASDDNPGTRERPFATINRAAQALAPGERVSWKPAFTGSASARREAERARTG